MNPEMYSIAYLSLAIYKFNRVKEAVWKILTTTGSQRHILVGHSGNLF